MGRKSPRIQRGLTLGRRVLRRPVLWWNICGLFLWWLLVVLFVLLLYAFLYWGLAHLSGNPLRIQSVADHLHKMLSEGEVLVAVIAGLVGLSAEWQRRSAEEMEKSHARRREEALRELEQLGEALRQRRYGDALALYSLFRERCQRDGIWEDIGIWENVRSIWEQRAPKPLQTWAELVEGNRQPEPTLPVLEALAWGHRLDPRNWEEKGRELVGQLVAPDHLEALVHQFEQAPEAQRSLLRLEIIGERLEELEKSAGEDQKQCLATLQNWRRRPPLGIPLPWESIRRPSDPPGFVEWLQRWGFRENPFGPEIAEVDPILSSYGYWPLFLEPVRGSRPAMVLGAPGSGRTAAALLLYQKCLTPPASPEETGAFPVWLGMGSWPRSPDGWLKRLGQALAEALLQVCGRDPYALFGAPETATAIAHLFVWYFGPVGSTEAHLRRQGLRGEMVDYVLSEIETHTSRLPGENLDNGILWDLICKARPFNLKSTYLILDIPTFLPADGDPRVKSLTTLIEMTGLLAHRGVYLKLFLPAMVSHPLIACWPLKPIFMEWSEEDLREMLRLRLIWASEGYVESLQTVCTGNDYPPDPDTWLVRSAEGSPRRLVELGNEMLRKA